MSDFKVGPDGVAFEDLDDFMGKVLGAFSKASKSLKHVNIILAGKTGSGKSTLVNAVFREPIATVGIGKPVTDRTKCFEVDGVPARIYDTKGFELDGSAQNEVVSEIKQIIADSLKSEDEDKYIHAIWYCINAGTNRVEEKEFQWIRELAKQEFKPVPVVVVITQSFRKKAAEELRAAVDREIGIQVAQTLCVLAEADTDNEIPAFGVEELVQITYNLLPESAQRAFINAQGASVSLKERAAKKYLMAYIGTAALTGGVPVPFADAPLLIANEIAMCAHIAALFGIALDKETVSALATTLIGVPAVTFAGKTVVSNALKFLPGVGTVLGGVISGATAALLTAALGRTYIAILVQISRGELKKEDISNPKIVENIKNLMKTELAKNSTTV